MGSKLSKIFGRLAGGGTGEAASEAGATEDYKGYTIRPSPRRQGSQWLTEGVIVKTIGEEVKEHHFIRAELHSTRDDAEAFSIIKAKQIIDERGDRVFDGR